MKASRSAKMRPCRPKSALAKRPLLSEGQVRRLMEVFKVLANDTRLRLLHALARDDEVCVTNLAGAAGMKAQAVSNQIQRLADQGIVGARRDGNQMFYRIVDPCVPVLMDRGLCLMEDSSGCP